MGSPSRDSIHALFNICISMAICDLSEKNQHRCGELHGYDKIVLQEDVDGAPSTPQDGQVSTFGLGHELRISLVSDD